MAPLPSMSVTLNLKEILGITTDDELTESALSQARVTFTSNFPEDAWLRWGTSLYRVGSIGYPDVRVNTDGDIVLDDDDESPVLLLAQDDGLNVRGLQWHVAINFPAQVIPPAGAGQMRAWWFDATGDGTTVDLKTTIPVVATPIAGVSPMNQIFSSQILDAGDVGVELIQADDQADAWLALGNVPVGNLPDLSLIQYKGVKANQAAMLATTGELGDWITRTDTSTTWIITGNNPTQLASWTELPFPAVNWSNLSGRPPVIAAGATQAEARAAIDAEYSGVIPSGVKGGHRAILRRRDIPVRANEMWLGGVVVPTITDSSAGVATIPSYVNALVMPSPTRITFGGADTLTSANHSGLVSYFPNWLYPGGTTFPNPVAWYVQLSVDNCTDIEYICYFGNAATGYNLMIDGKWVWRYPKVVTFTDFTASNIRFTLPDKGKHDIRLYLNGGELHHVSTNPSATVWAKPLRGPTLFALGDSNMQGGAQSTGDRLGSYLYRLANNLGVDDVRNGGIHATGFVADASGTSAIFSDRATSDAVPSNADIVLIGGYFNDRNIATATVAARLGLTIDTLQDMTSDPMVIMCGSWDPLGANGAPYTAMDTALKATCVSREVPYIEPRTGSVYDGAGNLVLNGTSTAGPWITSANVALYIGGDNIHYTDAGRDYIADRMAQAIVALLPA